MDAISYVGKDGDGVTVGAGVDAGVGVQLGAEGVVETGTGPGEMSSSDGTGELKRNRRSGVIRRRVVDSGDVGRGVFGRGKDSGSAMAVVLVKERGVAIIGSPPLSG